MKKNAKLMLVLLAIACAALICASCGGGDDTTEAPKATTTETPATTTTTVATTTVYVAPERTTRVTTTGQSGTLNVVWHLGYVGSATNGQNFKNVVNPNGGSYSYTDVITIAKKGTKITFVDNNSNANGDTGFASAAAYVISNWKQENGEWVIDLDRANYAGSGGSASDIATVSGSTVTYTYITSEDNENIRLCFRSGQSTSFTPAAYPEVTFLETEELGTYMQTVGGLDAWAEQSKTEAYHEILKGLTVNAIGDSYFAGNGLDPKLVWPALLAKKYDMTFDNKGMNGSTIGKYVTNKNPMVDRYVQMPDNNPDIVILEGGRNDFNVATPIGTNADTDPALSFKGAVNDMITKLQAKYPNALIICVTNWNVKGWSSGKPPVLCTGYADAMREVCEERGVVCFYAADIEATGVDMNNATFRSTYCMGPNDVSHLNGAGHKMVFPKFEDFIANAYAEFLASK